MPGIPNTSPDQPTRGSGAVLLTLGSLFAAFGVASCCGLPFMLATLGLGTAWLGGFALLAAPHRLFLLAAATVWPEVTERAASTHKGTSREHHAAFGRRSGVILSGSNPSWFSVTCSGPAQT